MQSKALYSEPALRFFTFQSDDTSFKILCEVSRSYHKPNICTTWTRQTTIGPSPASGRLQKVGESTSNQRGCDTNKTIRFHDIPSKWPQDRSECGMHQNDHRIGQSVVCYSWTCIKLTKMPVIRFHCTPTKNGTCQRFLSCSRRDELMKCSLPWHLHVVQNPFLANISIKTLQCSPAWKEHLRNPNTGRRWVSYKKKKLSRRELFIIQRQRLTASLCYH